MPTFRLPDRDNVRKALTAPKWRLPKGGRGRWPGVCSSGGVITVLLNRHSLETSEGRVAAGPVGELFAAAGAHAMVRVAGGGELEALARDALGGRPSIVVAGGGDGTISTVAGVVAGTGTALGVLPMGTLNHFAKDLGIPLDLPAAVQVIAAGRTVPVDMGEVNGRTFINNASLGVYPSLVYHREKRQGRGYRKSVALALAAVEMWQRYRRVRVLVHTEGAARTVHTPFVFVGNNEYALTGAEFGGRRRLDQGALHVAMAHGMSRGQMARALGLALVGRLASEGQLDTLLTSDLTIAARRRHLRVALDGEITPLRTPLHFRVRPGALRVCVPATGA